MSMFLSLENLSTKNNQPKEEERLLIALSGLQNEEHWYNSKTSVSFISLKE